MKHHALQARIEFPFAAIKNKWMALSGNFAEDDAQHELLLMFAVGVYNLEREH